MQQNVVAWGVIGILCLWSVMGLAKPISFTVQPVFDGTKSMRLQVTTTFNGDADGETEIAFPGDFGSASALYKCIDGVRCHSKNVEMHIDRDFLYLKLEHKGGAEIKLSYYVVQDEPGSAPTADHAFRPVIQPDFFHVYGNSLLLMPKGWKQYEVQLDWINFPQSWQFLNSFGEGRGRQFIQFDQPRWAESVFVGGDFRILRAEVQHNPVYLAIRGRDWAFSDDQLMEILVKTVSVQRDFWSDHAIPFYAVTLLPLAVPAPEKAENSIQYMGTGLLNSFSAFATPSPYLKADGFCHLFNHEMMHDWIGNKIRNGGAFNDMSYAWFSEGFTEYFAYKNMVRAGFITHDEYLTIVNANFFEVHYSASNGELPNASIAAEFFNNPAIRDLPYKRGFILAFYLDNALKKATFGRQTLHSFMLEMLDHYYEGNLDLAGNFDFFQKNLEKYLLTDMQPFIQTYVIEGKRIPASAFQLPDYWRMTVNEKGVPHFVLDGHWLDHVIACEK